MSLTNYENGVAIVKRLRTTVLNCAEVTEDYQQPSFDRLIFILDGETGQ
jgi:hypothetical protein